MLCTADAASKNSITQGRPVKLGKVVPFRETVSTMVHVCEFARSRLLTMKRVLIDTNAVNRKGGAVRGNGVVLRERAA